MNKLLFISLILTVIIDCIVSIQGSPPSNAVCENALTFSSNTATSFSNVDSDEEDTVSNFCYIYNVIWYKTQISPGQNDITINFGAFTAGQAAFFTGTDCESKYLESCDQYIDYGTHSLQITVQSLTVLYVAIGSPHGAQTQGAGDFTIKIVNGGTAGLTSNPLCGSATLLTNSESPQPFSTEGSNSQDPMAESNYGLTWSCYGTHNSWFYIPMEAGSYDVSLVVNTWSQLSVGAYPVLNLFTGTGCGDLNLQTCSGSGGKRDTIDKHVETTITSDVPFRIYAAIGQDSPYQMTGSGTFTFSAGTKSVTIPIEPETVGVYPLEILSKGPDTRIIPGNVFGIKDFVSIFAVLNNSNAVSFTYTNEALFTSAPVLDLNTGDLFFAFDETAAGDSIITVSFTLDVAKRYTVLNQPQTASVTLTKCRTQFNDAAGQKKKFVCFRHLNAQCAEFEIRTIKYRDQDEFVPGDSWANKNLDCDCNLVDQGRMSYVLEPNSAPSDALAGIAL